MPAIAVRRKPGVKCAVGSTPRRRDHCTVTFKHVAEVLIYEDEGDMVDVAEVYIHEDKGDMIPTDDDPPRSPRLINPRKLLKPEVEPSDRVSTPRRRNQHPVTFCDLPEVYTFEVKADMIPTYYDPPRLLKPKCEPSERRWGNAVDGFSDPIIDLAVARFKAVCLANGTGPVSCDDESWEPCPQLHPFSIEQVHEKEDRRLPVVIGETLCLILTITPDGFAPYKRGKLYREYKRVEFKSIPKEEFNTSEF